MQLDVFLTADELAQRNVSGRAVVVIDVLRASTTIAAAIANGARAIVPFEDTDEMLTRARQFESADVRLAGERKMRAVDGFDFGNSPLEFTPEAVNGTTVLLSTTNGTRALLATQGASDVVVGSYVNCGAVSAMLRTAIRGGMGVVIVCAGQESHYALEDAACAGRYVHAMTHEYPDLIVNDAARSCALVASHYGDDIAAVFRDSAHGVALADAGYGDDLVFCAAIDSHPVIPVYTDRQITKLGPGRAR